MKLQVPFERKIPTFNLSEAFIEAVVILPEQKFKAFSRGLLKDEDFIKDHKESMYVDEKGVRHSLLLLSEQADDGFKKYFPKSYTPKQMEDTIIKLLDFPLSARTVLIALMLP